VVAVVDDALVVDGDAQALELPVSRFPGVRAERAGGVLTALAEASDLNVSLSQERSDVWLIGQIATLRCGFA